jgi:hypothetical protein
MALLHDSAHRARRARRPARAAAIEPGMPLPAGSGLDRRSFLARARGLALAVYGGRRAAPAASSEGIARAGAANRPVLVSRLPRRRRRLALDARSRPATRSTASCGRSSRSPRAGPPFAEDGRLRWHPSLAALAQLHGEGKVSVLPAIGYDRANQSHFTSRHFWEVGATDAAARTGWLGRYLDRLGSPDNPLQGSRSTGACSLRSRPAGCPSRRSTGPTATTSGRAASGARSETRCSTRSARSARSGTRRPGLGRRPRRGQSRGCRQLAPFGEGRRAGRSPVAYPQATTVPARLAGLAAMLAARAADPLRRADGAGHVRHARRPGRSSRRAEADRRLAARFQRDLEARGSPTACSCSSGRSSAGARRRTARTAPTTAPPARAS